MKIIGFISFMVISAAGALPYSERVVSTKVPDISGFLPGGWQHTARQTSGGCD